MAKVIALSNISHGEAEGGRVKMTHFTAGEVISGIPEDAVKSLVATGAAVAVEKPVKVEHSDPTVVRDTAMVMAGKYPQGPNALKPAIGNVPVNVVSAEEAERITALEAEVAAKEEEAAQGRAAAAKLSESEKQVAQLQAQLAEFQAAEEKRKSDAKAAASNK